MNKMLAEVRLKRCNLHPLIQCLQLANYIGPLALFVCGTSVAIVCVINTACVHMYFCLANPIYCLVMH